MTVVKLAEYLFKRISDAGVEHTFGVPGDFVLPVYAAQERFGLKTVVMTHEPSAGYAADAYARLKGLGVALVTYGAGGLNIVNPVALAYAEESPLLVISGAPETRHYRQKPELHHCVKNFQTQYNVFAEVTEAQALLGCPGSARREIDRVVDSVLSKSRPGYIEIPRDMVNQEISLSGAAPIKEERRTEAVSEAAAEIAGRLNSAQHPVLLVGAEIRRFKLMDAVVALSEKLNAPAVTSILGKASFPESHPNFIGIYFGHFGSTAVRKYVESSDCVVCLGAVLTEMETGGYTAKLDPDRLIQMTAAETTVGYHSYRGIELSQLLSELAVSCSTTRHADWTALRSTESPTHPAGSGELTVIGIIEELNRFLRREHIVVSDVGDCLYAGLSLKTDTFIAPGYYSSMGFGVPAGIGAQMAVPESRPVVLVGDGGFQMTGMEISTAVKLGLNPIVIVFNNGSYGMLRFVDQQRDYYKLPRWDYVSLAKAVGADGVQAATQADFHAALKQADKSKQLCLIDARLKNDDISPTLKRLTDHFRKKIRAATL